MPRNVINVATVYGVGVVLLLSVVWAQMVFKKKAMQNYSNALDSIKTSSIYEKCRWVFATGDLQLIMQTLAHVSYKEHIICLKAYMDDKTLFDTQLKTVILFKTAILHKKNNKKIQMLAMLPQDMKKDQLLLKIAATHCPDIIPTLYGWIKTHSEDYVQKQVSEVYSYAINHNNPLLFNCLLEYDIPLQPHQASEYLSIVLNEKKHQAFVCLLMKAGAKMAPQSAIENAINRHLVALQDSKNTFYRQLFPLTHV